MNDTVGTEIKKGRPTVIQLAIDNFILALRDIDPSDVAALKVLWADALNQFNAKSEATKATYGWKFRTAVRQAHGEDHPILSLMKVQSGVNVSEPKWQGKKPSYRKEATTNFANNVRQINGSRDVILEAVTTLWQSELNSGLLDGATNTIISTITDYRSALKAIGLEHELEQAVLAIVSAPQAAKDQRNTEIALFRATKRASDLLEKKALVIEKAAYCLPTVEAIWRDIESKATEIGKDLSRRQSIETLFALHLLTGLDLKHLCTPKALQPTFVATPSRTHKAYKAHFLSLSDKAEFATLIPAKKIYGAWLALHAGQSMQHWSTLNETALHRAIGAKLKSSSNEETSENIYDAGEKILGDIVKSPLTRQRVQDFYAASVAAAAR